MAKLNPAPPRERTGDRIGITPKSTKFKGVYFKLTNDDIVNLNNIVSKISEVSRKRVSKTKVIQALLHIGVSIEPKKFIKAFGEIM